IIAARQLRSEGGCHAEVPRQARRCDDRDGLLFRPRPLQGPSPPRLPARDGGIPPPPRRALQAAQGLRAPASRTAADAFTCRGQASGPALAVLRIPGTQGRARPGDRHTRRDHRGARLCLRDGRALPQFSPRLRARPPSDPSRVAEVPLPLLLLPRSALRPPPCPPADLVPVHHPGLRQRPRVAPPPTRPPRAPLPETGERLPLARRSRACSAARRSLRDPEVARDPRYSGAPR